MSKSKQNDAQDYARISVCGEVTYFVATPDPGRNKLPSARLRLKIEEQVSDDHTRTLYVGVKAFGDIVERIEKEVVGRGAIVEITGAMASEPANDPETDYKDPLKDVNGKTVYETVVVIDDAILEQHDDALIVHEAGTEDDGDDRGGGDRRGGGRSGGRGQDRDEDRGGGRGGRSGGSDGGRGRGASSGGSGRSAGGSGRGRGSR